MYRLLFDTGPDLTLTLDFVHADGDLDLALYDAAGDLVQTSDGAADDESLVAEDLAHGRYYAEVYGFDGASNNYALEGNVAAWPAAEWDVGFVVGDAVEPTAADEAIANRLTFDLSSEVTLIDDDDTESYGAYDLVVISSSTDEGTVGGKYDENADVPVLNLQRLTWDDHGLSTYPGWFDIDEAQVTSQGWPHAINRGVVDDSAMFNTPVPVGTTQFWNLTAAAAIAFSATGNIDYAAVFTYEDGADIHGGTDAGGRRAAIGLDQTVVDDLTSTGWRIFDQTVEWTRDPTPGAPVGLVIDNPGEPTAGDLAILRRLVWDDDADVTLIDDSATESYGAYDLIVITASTEDYVIENKYDEDAAVPIVNLNRWTWDEHGLSAYDGWYDEDVDDVVIDHGAHPINAGLGDPVTMFDSAVPAGTTQTWNLTADAYIPYSAEVDPDYAAVFAYPEGADLHGATDAGGRRAAIGLDEGVIDNLTADGWQIFDQTIAWALDDTTIDVGLVMNNPASPTAGDQLLHERLAWHNNANVVPIDDSATESYGAYDLIVITASTEDWVVYNKYDADATVPIVNLQKNVWGDHDLAVYGGWYDIDVQNLQETASHPIHGDLPDPVAMFDTAVPAGTTQYWNLGPDVTIAYSATNEADYAAVFTYDPGDDMANSAIAGHRRAAIGLEDAVIDNLTPDGWTIFDNTITWAVAP